MAKRMELRGRTAVITGAASGIGRSLALEFAGRGCDLALADRDVAGLDAVAAEAGRRGVRASRHPIDLVDAAAIAALPEAVLAHHRGVDLVVNNAGVALGGTFEQVSERDFDWLFDINFFGVVRMTRAFLPTLKRSDDARLVNVSSLYGFVAPPGQTAYAASKFAVRGFSQALRLELEGTSVGVTTVHPGGVATAIARNARMPAGATPEQLAQRVKFSEKLLRLPPERAAAAIADAIVRRKPRVIVGSDAKLVSLIERVLPVSYGRVLAAMAGRA